MLAEVELNSNIIDDKLLNSQQLNFYIKIRSNQVSIFFDKYYIKAILLIDIETSDRVFVDRKFVKLYKFFIILFQNSIKLRLADNKFASNIIYAAQVIINLSNYIDIL